MLNLINQNISLEITRITFFKFNSLKTMFWAFKAMGLYSSQLQKVSGAKFIKLLGSGGSGGFGVWPNFKIYGILSVWNNRSEMAEFEKTSLVWQEYNNQAAEITNIELSCIMAHGLWDNTQPFFAQKQEITNEMVVLTRGRIKWSKLVQFWWSVAPSSKAMFANEGIKMAVGVGELPLVQQATISIWKNAQAMQDFAYKSGIHKHVIKQTKEQKWYSEDLFARFKIIFVSDNFYSFFR